MAQQLHGVGATESRHASDFDAVNRKSSKKYLKYLNSLGLRSLFPIKANITSIPTRMKRERLGLLLNGLKDMELPEKSTKMGISKKSMWCQNLTRSPVHHFSKLFHKASLQFVGLLKKV